MTTKPRDLQTSRWPLESYGPEWKELWLKASKGEVRIDFKSESELRDFRLRSQVYRKLMQRKNAEGWNLLYRATSRRVKGSLTLIYLPREEHFAQYFDQIGIAPAPLRDPLVDILGAPKAPEDADS